MSNPSKKHLVTGLEGCTPVEDGDETPKVTPVKNLCCGVVSSPNVPDVKDGSCCYAAIQKFMNKCGDVKLNVYGGGCSDRISTAKSSRVINVGSGFAHCHHGVLSTQDSNSAGVEENLLPGNRCSGGGDVRSLPQVPGSVLARKIPDDVDSQKCLSVADGKRNPVPDVCSGGWCRPTNRCCLKFCCSHGPVSQKANAVALDVESAEVSGDCCVGSQSDSSYVADEVHSKIVHVSGSKCCSPTMEMSHCCDSDPRSVADQLSGAVVAKEQCLPVKQCIVGPNVLSLEQVPYSAVDVGIEADAGHGVKW